MVEVDNLNYQYPGNSTPTLNGIRFNIGKGDVLGFLGPSGAGKSTTQKILYKLLKGYQGTVKFSGKDLNLWGRDFYKLIGVGFELPNHYLKLTARENLRFFSSLYGIDGRTIDHWLDRVGLLADAGKLVAEYSKGMKMRLNFVRSVMHDPQVLFLDEPTSGLDPVNARIIKDSILELRSRGKTIFITTHNMSDADLLCDRVALLQQGEIKAMDTPENLKYAFGKRKVRVESLDKKEMLFDMDTLGDNQDFLALLKDNQIRTIHSEEASLEDVFIHITGTRLT